MPPTSSPQATRVATGIEGLDYVLGGGLPENRIYLIQGEPGVGKTTLALQFLLEGVRVGESGLYVTLSETREELEEVARSHGWDLSALTMHEMSSVEQRFAAQQQNTLFYPAEVELNETVEQVMQLVDSVHPKRLVFDSLSEMRLLAGESLAYRRQILALKQRLARYRTTVMFIDDKTGEQGADLQLRSLAHGVVDLSRERNAFGGLRRFLEVIKMRGVDFATGLHELLLLPGGAQVHPRLVAENHRREFQNRPVGSGSPALDALQNGGPVAGTTTVLVGPSGCGKSTVAGAYVLAAVKNRMRAAVFNFDENRQTFFERSKGAGMNLRPYDEGDLAVFQVDPAEMGPGEFVGMVRHEVEKHQAQMIVIDSLNGYFHSMPGTQYLTLHMHELLTYLNQMACVTLVTVTQHGLMGHMQTPVDITYLADAVLLFRYFEAQGRVRKAISVVKKRLGGHEDAIRELQISDAGIFVGEPLSEFQGVLTGTPAFLGKSSTLLHEPSGE